MRDRQLILAGAQREVHAAVVVLAEFRVQLRDQFSQRLPVPGHQLGQQQRHHGGVALGQIEFRADSAGFLATQKNVVFEHQFADVFETDRRFVNFAAEARGDFVDQLCRRKSFGDVARDAARAGQMPQQQRENLVRRNERPRAIHRADAVAVAIGAESGVVAAGEHGAAQGLNVRLDRFWIRAAEERIARAANFIAGDSVAAEKLAEQTARRAVHGVDDEAQAGGGEAIPIH